jgi:4a-hydroxytetrahydrobiopterin dehydratase
MAASLRDMHCIPCEKGATPLAPHQVQTYLQEVPDWKLTSDARRIGRAWRAKNFVAALQFFEQIAKVAESEDHHPDLHLTNYRDIFIEIWTHSINGLSENDFILAAKIDGLPVELKD